MAGDSGAPDAERSSSGRVNQRAGRKASDRTAARRPSSGDARPPRRRGRVAGLVAIALVLVSALATFAFIRSDAPQRIVEAGLRQQFPGATVNIGSAAMRVDLSASFLVLRASRVEISHGETSLVVPSASLSFGAVPAQLALHGATINIVIGADGWLASPEAALVGLIAGGIPGLPAQLATPPAGRAPAPAPDATRPWSVRRWLTPERVQLRDARIDVARHQDDGTVSKLTFERVVIGLGAAGEGAVGGTISAGLTQDGERLGGFEARVTAHAARRDLDVRINADGLGLAGLARFFPDAPPPARAIAGAGRLTGSARLQVRAGAIESASIDVRTAEGRIDAPGVLRSPAKHRGTRLKMRYFGAAGAGETGETGGTDETDASDVPGGTGATGGSGETGETSGTGKTGASGGDISRAIFPGGGRVELDAFSVAFVDGGSVALSGEVGLGPGASLARAAIVIESRDTSTKRLLDIWPPIVLVRTRNWLERRIAGGRVSSLRVEMSGAREAGRFVVSDLAGTIEFRDSRLELGAGIAPITDIDATLHLGDNMTRITYTRGSMAGIELASGEMTIAPLLNAWPAGGRANAAFRMRGGVADALGIAASLGIDSASGLRRAGVAVDGPGEYELKLAFPVRGKVPVSQFVYALKASMGGGAVTGLPLVGDARDVDLEVSLEPGLSSFRGRSIIMGVSADIDYEGGGEGRHMFRVATHGSTNFTALLNRVAGPGLAGTRFAGTRLVGRTGGRVTIRADRAFRDFTSRIELGFKRAELDVPEIIGDDIAIGEGGAGLRLAFEDRKLVSIEDFRLDAQGIKAVGGASFRDDSKARRRLHAMRIENFSWRGNDITHLEARRVGEGRWSVDASAGRLDIAGLLGGGGAGNLPWINFDILADELLIGQGVRLGGHMNGELASDGKGTAQFSGDMFYRDRLLFSEGVLDVGFGAGGRFARGAGLVGGAETHIDYNNPTDEDASIVVKSKNGGRVLNALGLTGSVRSGDFELHANFVGGFADIDARVYLKEFSVVDAPPAVRALSVLAPNGLFRLVQGEGVGFRRGEAHIEKRGSDIRLSRVSGSGTSIAALFLGRYNLESRDIDISGHIVPANFLSDIIDEVPIVGDILTGDGYTGVFATQFSLTGNAAAPNVSVKPTSFLPGIFRDIFNPNWLEKESERIFDTGEGEDAGG